MHYCCDKLVDVSVYSKADCGHESESSDYGIKRTSCCDNESLVFASETHVSSVSSKIDLKKSQVIVPVIEKLDRKDVQHDVTYDSRAGPPDSRTSKIYLINSSFC